MLDGLYRYIGNAGWAVSIYRLGNVGWAVSI